MRLTQLKGLMERIEDVLDADLERRGGHGQQQAVLDLRGGVRLDGVAFKYPSESKPTVEEVSFTVLPGESVAIVGASGSGKSTIARVLAGLYEPCAGTVLYDERPASSLDLRKLRERLGVVTQDVRLFSGSIRDNVSMFENQLAHDRIQRACELAALHDDIMAMPMGYDTVLADGRALVRGPAVLVLDEATSALDTVTETKVQECLRALQCTRIIVAHRLSTIMEADKIVVMSGGRVSSIGKHAELIASCPTYQRLVRAQHEQQRGVQPLVSAPQSQRPPRPAANLTMPFPSPLVPSTPPSSGGIRVPDGPRPTSVKPR
jgi:ABC-type bacteriocin/lantibiotic exporter with double-glycine peptidase domain